MTGNSSQGPCRIAPPSMASRAAPCKRPVLRCVRGEAAEPSLVAKDARADGCRRVDALRLQRVRWPMQSSCADTATKG